MDLLNPPVYLNGALSFILIWRMAAHVLKYLVRLHAYEYVCAEHDLIVLAPIDPVTVKPSPCLKLLDHSIIILNSDLCRTCDYSLVIVVGPTQLLGACNVLGIGAIGLNISISLICLALPSRSPSSRFKVVCIYL